MGDGAVRRELRATYGSLSQLAQSVLDILPEHQAELVAVTLEDPHFRSYPPSVAYQRSFWRQVVRSVEDSGEVSLSWSSPSCAVLF